MMDRSLLRPFLFIAGCWVAMLLAVTAFRPLMPVDETRYMTVAWEMLVRHNFLLPSLNYEPYSHKPPLLFWIINTAWAVFGVGVTPVRVLMSAVILGLFALTAKLARTVLPARDDVPARAMLLLAALPAFLVYAGMIMFDSLLATLVVAGLLSVWHAGQGGRRAWLYLGLSVGVGVLAKGPVALVYMLPVALLAPLWLARPQNSWKKWYGGIGIAFLIAAAVGLAWAVPAALSGGEAYAQKIFVTQSAGRMVNAFDHVRPFWFYVPAVAGFLAPLLVWPALWSGLRARVKTLLADDASHRAVRFLAAAVIPAFLFFSAISSKQIHYMIPLLPATCVLAAAVLPANPTRTFWPLALSTLPSLVYLGVYVAAFAGVTPRWAAQLDGFLPAVALMHVAGVAALSLAIRKNPAQSYLALAAAACLLVVTLHVQLGQRILPRYDFAPLASAIVPYRDAELAVVPKYDGEYGFALRLERAVETPFHDDAGPWLAQHPQGVMIVRDRMKEEPKAVYDVLFMQPFRGDGRVSLVRSGR